MTDSLNNKSKGKNPFANLTAADENGIRRKAIEFKFDIAKLRKWIIENHKITLTMKYLTTWIRPFCEKVKQHEDKAWELYVESVIYGETAAAQRDAAMSLLTQAVYDYAKKAADGGDADVKDITALQRAVNDCKRLEIEQQKWAAQQNKNAKEAGDNKPKDVSDSAIDRMKHDYGLSQEQTDELKDIKVDG